MVIKAAINHLNSLREKNLFVAEPAFSSKGRDILQIMHPECILEWVKALDLQIS